MSKYSEFYLLLNKIGQPKEAIISDFTKGRTESLRALSTKEYNALCASLRKTIAGINVPSNNDKANQLRKAIISCFHQMKYKSPVPAAVSWAEKMGVSVNGENVKRAFNAYSTQELHQLLQKAQKAVSDFRLSIRKSISND